MYIMSCPSGISALFLWTVHFHACQPKTIHLTIHARHYALGGWGEIGRVTTALHPKPIQNHCKRAQTPYLVMIHTRTAEGSRHECMHT